MGGVQKVYAVEDLGTAVINDEVGGSHVSVFIWDGGAAAYSPLVDGQTLSFALVAGDVVDDATGSAWSRGGVAIAGPLAGTVLGLLPARSTFWFAYVGAFPSAEVYVPGGAR